MKSINKKSSEPLKTSQIPIKFPHGTHDHPTVEPGHTHYSISMSPGLPYHMLATPTDDSQINSIVITQTRFRRWISNPLFSAAKFTVRSLLPNDPKSQCSTTMKWLSTATLRLSRVEDDGMHSLSIYNDPDTFFSSKRKIEGSNGAWYIPNPSSPNGTVSWFWGSTYEQSVDGWEWFELYRHEGYGTWGGRVGVAKIKYGESGFERGWVDVEDRCVDRVCAVVGLFMFLRWRMIWERGEARRKEKTRTMCEGGDGDDG